MSDPIDDLPRELRDLVRMLLRRVAVAGKRKKPGDRGGSEAQKELSQALQDAGIYKSDRRYTPILRYGRQLYEGKISLVAKPPAPVVPHVASGEGPVYTHGADFRARAEALARRFRAEHLRVGHGKYGHILDDVAIESGANFLHPAALAAANARAARGKGVDRARTFGNMLSSQALCFNVFGPLARVPGGLDLARDVLAPHVPGLAKVVSIDIEYTPAPETFRDQRGLAGVDCDTLLEIEDAEGQRGVLVIELKLVKKEFSCCGHRDERSSDPCPEDVLIGKDFGGCRYVYKNAFAYWQRAAESGCLDLSFVEQPGCPFAGPLWQLWVNHTLAHAEAKRRGARRALFAVCAPQANETLRASASIDQYRERVTDPASLVFIPLEELLESLVSVRSARPEWASWALALRRRYLVAPAELAAGADDSPEHRPVTARQRRVVEWMGTPAFRELVAIHQAALGDRMSVYFRPNDGGLVRIALHPEAPRYLGFQPTRGGNACVHSARSPLPTAGELNDVLLAFEAWAPKSQQKDEERGVIAVLRRALANRLALPELGDGWVFLHQEWRFVADGRGRNADVLAVHLATGQLGIVEFKSRQGALEQARVQVEEYSELWERDAADLAPFFTDMLRALGLAYGNDLAVRATVQAGPAELFVGVAGPSGPARVWRHMRKSLR